MICLAPYSLHSDLSGGLDSPFMSKYFLPLRDFHNAGYTYETMRNILKPEFQTQMELRGRDFLGRIPFYNRTISFQEALDARKEIDNWNDRYYPKTLEENKQILENYLSLLEKYNVQPILFITPRVKEYKELFSKQILDEFFDFLNELYTRHDFIFVNGWAMDFEDRDFYDMRHMNYNGAKKFTKILNDVVNKLEGMS